MKLKIIQILDIICAILVCSSLFLAPRYSDFWLFYASGCLGYLYVSYKKRLWGCFLLNIVAMVIAISNYIRG